jgi:hypothetical protein
MLYFIFAKQINIKVERKRVSTSLEKGRNEYKGGQAEEYYASGIADYGNLWKLI